MKTHLLTALLIAGSSACFSQTTVFPDNHVNSVSTTVLPGSRYEITQSDFGMGSVFKVDKYLGQVSYITFGKWAYQNWSKIERLNHPADTITDKQTVNYQLFAGKERKFTYLMNVNTGATWVLVMNKKGSCVWDPIFKEE